MTTVQSDTAQAPQVAPKSVQTARISVTAPLVATVAAGTASTETALTKKRRKAKKAKAASDTSGVPTILDLLHQVAAAGVAKGAIDPRNTSDNLNPSCVFDGSEMEAELSQFLSKGTEGHGWDDPDFFEDSLSRSGGVSPLSMVKEYYAWREARRQFCDKLRGYLAHVEKDEAKRQKEEAGLNLMPTIVYSAEDNNHARRTGWKKFAAQLESISNAMDTGRGVWESDSFLDRLGDLPGMKPLNRPKREADEFLRTIGDLLFDDRLEENREIDATERMLEIRNALQVAATMLYAPIDSPENKLLVAAAVTVQRMRDKAAKKTSKHAKHVAATETE